MTAHREHQHWFDLLQESVRIDSRTIEGAAGTTQVAELFGRELREMGFDLVWVDPVEESPRGRHLHAVHSGKAQRHLVLMGHTDTVLSPGEVPQCFDGPRVTGSGVFDMKGGCVLMLAALHDALRQSSAVREARIDVLLNCSEEISGPSFRKLARPVTAGAHACLSFEPAHHRHQLVVSRKGVVRFELTCTGRAAHSGVDHRFGVNAIRELARKIEALETLTDYQQDLTLNVGLIRGGRAVNQVADEAWACFDLRAYDPQVLARATQRVREICAPSSVRSPHDDAATTLRLSEHPSYPTWPAGAATMALAQQYIRIAQRHGVNVATVQSGGGADASHVADLAPTIDGLGILGGAAHQPQEWADLQSFPLRTRLAAEMIVELCENELLLPAAGAAVTVSSENP